jgi:ribonuclease HI
MGIAMNNQVEAYTLLQGMSIAISLGIREFTINEDSRIIIKSLAFKEPLKDFQLASILARIIKLTQKLNKLSCFHVLEENNGKQDSLDRDKP